MCRSIQDKASSTRTQSEVPTLLSQIGNIFRIHGETYIQAYKPNIDQIKLIRAIRICKTPQLGGIVLQCKSCKAKRYLYKSCGHSQCMLCQSIKREQWVEKLKTRLLAVPYVHMVFTLPHFLNGVARANKDVMYDIVIRSAWEAVEGIIKEYKAKPGMTSVLHTFGSDLHPVRNIYSIFTVWNGIIHMF